MERRFKDSRVQAYCQRDGTKWRFNVEAAPWWGGFFERLVKSVKLSVKKCLRNARLNYDELSTTLVEVKLNAEPDNAVSITVVRGEDVPAVVANPS